MDEEKWDVYVVIIPANNDAFEDLSMSVDTIGTIAQDVTYEEAKQAAKDVER